MDHGGWTKEVPFSEMAWQEGWPKSTQVHKGVELGSFDDGKTTAEIRFLATVYLATGGERFRDGVLRGLDFIFAAQYPSGGWPQSYPERGNYSDYVTFNDQAMIRIMWLLTEVAEGAAPYTFIDEEVRTKAQTALERGLDYILNAQIVVDGVLTGWNQQHDPVTYAPRPGRPYEPVAITAYETVGIVEYLMSLPEPSVEVRRAILSALEWLESSRLPDGRWARFYEIGTNRPIFLGRDGVVRYSVTEIDEERQSGYAWYGTWPHNLLHRAAHTGYLDQLHASLPDHPTPRLLIRGHFAGQEPTVQGSVPLDIEVASHDPTSITRVLIQIDDNPLYDDGAPPTPGSLDIDTTKLANGLHTLSVTVYTGDGKAHTRSTHFRVANDWRLIEEFRPPDVSAWFGTVDYLQAVERSDGWQYATDRPGDFLNDATRLTRAMASTEYLTWDTPALHHAEIVLFVTDAKLAGHVELSADSGQGWQPLSFTVEAEQVSEAGWYRVLLQPELLPHPTIARFRLTLPENLPAESIQLGRVLLAGDGTP